MGQKELNTVFIYTGGDVRAQKLPRPPADARVIAADSGYALALACGVTPELLLGDMDSLGDLPLPPTLAVERVKAEKNETDTMLAVDRALSFGGKSIVILGGLGGRFDHALSNLFLLEYLHNRGATGLLCDGQNRVRYLRDGRLTLPRAGFRYFSLLAAGESAAGVTIRGCKYPLTDATLTCERQYAVSNEFADDAAEISVVHGSLFIVESNP